MVIAAALRQLCYVRTNRLFAAKVERRAVYAVDFPCGDQRSIHIGIAVRVDLKQMVEHVGAVLPVEIEIGVIRQIHDRVRVGCRRVSDHERVVRRQAIAHLAGQRAGIALLLRRTHIAEHHAAVCHLAVKDTACKSAVQMVRTGVRTEPDHFAAERKSCVFDTVGVSADEGAEKAAAVFVALQCVVAEHHIARNAVFVGDHHPLHRTGVAEELHAHAVFIF